MLQENINNNASGFKQQVRPILVAAALKVYQDSSQQSACTRPEQITCSINTWVRQKYY